MVERAELNEDFFKAVFPNQEIKDADEFRVAVKNDLQSYWDKQSANHLQHELYHILLEQTQIDFPADFLKRWLQNGGDNPRSPEDAEKEYPSFVNQLKWTLIIDKISRENNLEVNPDDLKAFAKQQLFGYMGGMTMDAEQPWINDYVNKMMQDRKFVEDSYHRIQAEKVFDWADKAVNATEKPVSVEDFTKELEKHQHHHH
jgi:trigger factor